MAAASTTSNLKSETKSSVNDGFPDCNVELDYEKFKYWFLGSSFEKGEDDPLKIFENIVGGDCWGVKSYYTILKGEMVVDYNAFILEDGETQYCFNKKHPNYVNSYRKVKEHQFRLYLCGNVKKYWEDVNKSELYFGDEIRLEFTKGQDEELYVKVYVTEKFANKF